MTSALLLCKNVLLYNTSCKFNDITLRISQTKLKPSYTHGAYIMESSSRRVKLNFFQICLGYSQWNKEATSKEKILTPNVVIETFYHLQPFTYVCPNSTMGIFSK